MICHVTVRTPKLNETVEFYQWLLDLPVARRFPIPGGEIVFLGGNETKLELIGDADAGKVSAKGLTIGFAVDNLSEKTAMLDGRLIPHSEIMSPAPDARFAYFTDLNGCEIQLLEEIR